MKGLKRVTRRRDDALSRVGWERLETLLAAYYRSEGYEVEHVGTGATGARFDGGIDLKLRRDGQFIVVQCKHWNAMKVPHNAVHELLGLMVNHGATGAILATSGEFTKAAIEAAQRLGHVRLVDGDDLRQMLGPIREPGAAFDVRMGEGVGGAMARRVGERLLSAAEDRIRHGGGRPATRGLGPALACKLLAGVLLLAAVMLVYQLMIRSVPALPAAVSPPRAAQAARPAAPTPAARSAGSERHDRCREPLNARSGAYAERCAPDRATRMSAERARAEQRRADEAIQVIADSTPEL